MKKLLLTLLGVLVMLPTFARKFSYTYEGQTLYYIVDEWTQTVEVAGGDEYKGGNWVYGELIIPYNAFDISTAKHYKVTSIGSYAFLNCKDLTKVTISDSVTEIGGSAFKGCTELREVTISNWLTKIGDSAFAGCSGLTEVTIPNLVTSIGDSAFRECEGLREVTIPNSVTSIGNSAFYGCGRLMEVTLSNSVTEISAFAFYGCGWLMEVTIPDSVTKIGVSAFAGCSGLTEVTIPNLVTSIGDSAFRDCEGLTEVTIPDSVTEIGGGAFEGCSGLREVTIHTSSTSIGDYAFKGCDHLTNVISNSVTPPSISPNSFEGLYSTATLTVPAMGAWDYIMTYWGRFSKINCLETDTSVVAYSDGGLNYRLFKAMNSDEKNIAVIGPGDYSGEIYVPEIVAYTDEQGNTERYYVNAIGGLAFYNTSTSKIEFNSSINLKTIGVGAFQGCSGLTEVKIPNSVTSIGGSAFSGCNGLTEVTIPNSVTDIGDWAFSECSRLTEVTIPNSVTKIGDRAFQDCSGLTEVTIPNRLEAIGANAFEGCKSLIKGAYPDVISNPFPSNTVAFGYDTFDSSIEYGFVFSRKKDALYYVPFSVESDYVIPESVTKITDKAFYGCENLSQVTLPDNLSNLGDSVWDGCDNISTVICLGSTPIEAERNLFMPTVYDDATLVIPQGSLQAYNNVIPWKYFYDIEEKDFSAVETVYPGNNTIDYVGPVEVYDLNGVKVTNSMENLAKGIYIVRQGEKVEKVMK